MDPTTNFHVDPAEVVVHTPEVVVHTPAETTQQPVGNQNSLPTQATPPRAGGETLLLCGSVICSCFFAVSFAYYVLIPAITSLAGSSATTWSDGF